MGGSACGGSETGLLRTISGLPRETALAESKRGKKEGGDYLYLLKIQIFFLPILANVNRTEKEIIT